MMEADKGKDQLKKVVKPVLVVGSAGCLAVALTVTAGMAGFDPTGYSANLPYQTNQIVFSGDTDYSVKQAEQGKSELWEQNKNAKDDMGTAQDTDAAYLFEAEKRIVNHPEANKVMTEYILDDPSSELQTAAVGDTWVLDANSADGVIMPGVSGDGVSGWPGGIPSGVGDASTTQKPEIDTKPSVPTVPSEGGSGSTGDSDGDNGGSSGGAVAPVEPTPEVPAEDPTRPDVPDQAPILPEDLYEQIEEQNPGWDMGVSMFPEEGLENTVGVELIEFSIYNKADTESILADQDLLPGICRGETVTEQKLLSALYIYADVTDAQGNLQTYRLTTPGEYFQIADYPACATEDFDITIRFRPNKNAEWTETTVRVPVYDYKVVLSDHEQNNIKELYFNEGESCDLRRYYKLILDAEAVAQSSALPAVFPGWSESLGGALVNPNYTPAQKGRIVLYPVAMQPVPKGMQVSYIEEYNAWRQCFDVYESPDGDSDDDILQIPEGVQEVAFLFDTLVQQVTIPSTVTNIVGNPISPQAHAGYVVAPENPVFTSQDGFLLSKDYTILYGAPFDQATVVVPNTVQDIRLSNQAIFLGIDEDFNFLTATPALRQLVLQTETVPALDLSRLDQVDIEVPEAAYWDYVSAWGITLSDSWTNNTLSISDGEAPSYELRGKLVLTENGQTLQRVMREANGSITVPNGVIVIADGALRNCTQVQSLAVSASVQMLGANCISDRVQKVIMLGDQPPQIHVDTFSGRTDVVVEVPELAYDAYLTQWGAVLGEDTARAILEAVAISIEEQNGFQYQVQGDKVTLLEAPEDLLCFDENSLPGVNITTIGMGAFSACGNLQIVDLPTSVNTIEANAFNGCGNLEGIVIENPEQITIQADSFANAENLRFIASNAMQANLEIGENDAYWHFSAYCPMDGTGYSANEWKNYDNSYMLEPLENGGQLLYGIDDMVGGAENGYYVVAATSDIQGIVKLREDTREIYDQAFWGCESSFTLDTDSLQKVIYIGDSAFAYSGLCGDLILPDTLQYLEDGAFAGCTQLHSVKLPAMLQSIGMSTFYGCTNLETVTFPENSILGSVGSWAFASCNRLAEIVLPASVTELWSNAFDDCSNLQVLQLQSTEPLRLFNEMWMNPFSFGVGLPDTFHVKLPASATAEDYAAVVDAWTDWFTGFDGPTTEEAIATIRQLLGMEEDVTGAETLMETEEATKVETGTEAAAETMAESTVETTTEAMMETATECTVETTTEAMTETMVETTTETTTEAAETITEAALEGYLNTENGEETSDDKAATEEIAL